MAVRTSEELMEVLKEKFDDSDDSLKVIEDFSDTFKEYETKIGEDWKTKYEQNDAEWRQRYRERFFSSPVEVKEEQKEHIKEEDGKVRTFDELFKEREG